MTPFDEALRGRGNADAKRETQEAEIGSGLTHAVQNANRRKVKIGLASKGTRQEALRFDGIKSKLCAIMANEISSNIQGIACLAMKKFWCSVREPEGEDHRATSCLQ